MTVGDRQRTGAGGLGRSTPGPDMRTIEAAIFDWDGTLADSRAALLAAWHESTSEVLGRGYPATPAEEDVVFTLPGAQIWPQLAGDERELAALAARFQEAYVQLAPRIRPFPGIVEMLHGLRDAGIAIAVVTSKARRRYAPDARNAGLHRLIDVAICAEDAGAAKPDPQPVLRALEDLGVPGSLAVMAGDTPVDVAAGIAAGTSVIGVAWGHASEPELRAAGAIAVARDPGALLAIALDGVEAL